MLAACTLNLMTINQQKIKTTNDLLSAHIEVEKKNRYSSESIVGK